MLTRSLRQLSASLLSFVYPALFVLGSMLLAGSCQPKKNAPGNNYTDRDLQITSSNNLWANNDSLSNYLISNGLSVRRAEVMAVVPESKNIFVVGNQHTILKLSPSGKPLFHIKNVGKGPGEILWAKQIKVRNGKLYVFDIKQNKISAFTLEGEFIHEIVPESGEINAFEVTKDGQIIIPSLYPAAGSTALFKILNSKGRIIDTFGNNKILQDDLQKTDMLPIVKLNLSPSGKLIITFSVPGTFYLYDLDTKKLTSRFNIRSGPEWEITAKKKSEMSKGVYSHVVNNITFTSSKNNIIVSTGGAFKKKVSIGMIFNDQGKFLGRIFGNNAFRNPPNNLAFINDSTLIISGFNQQLDRITLEENSTK